MYCTLIHCSLSLPSILPLPFSILPLLLSLSLSPCPPLSPPSLLPFPSLPSPSLYTHTHTHTQGSIHNECDWTSPHNQSCQEDDTLGSEFRGGGRGGATVTCCSLLIAYLVISTHPNEVVVCGFRKFGLCWYIYSLTVAGLMHLYCVCLQ